MSLSRIYLVANVVLIVSTAIFLVGILFAGSLPSTPVIAMAFVLVILGAMRNILDSLEA